MFKRLYLQWKNELEKNLCISTGDNKPGPWVFLQEFVTWDLGFIVQCTFRLVMRSRKSQAKKFNVKVGSRLAVITLGFLVETNENLFWGNFRAWVTRNFMGKTLQFTVIHCRILGNNSPKWEWQMASEPLIRWFGQAYYRFKIIKT